MSVNVRKTGALLFAAVLVWSVPVRADSDCAESAAFTLDNRGGGGLRVTAIDATYEGVFAQSVEAINTIKATVDWGNATAAYVAFDLNGEVTTVPTAGSTGQITYNMGADLLYSRGGKRNTLTAYAIAANGLKSQPQRLYFWGLALPQWAISFETLQDIGFRIDPLTGKLTFYGEVEVLKGGIKGTVDIPKSIPEVGGTWGLEIDPLNFKWELAAQPRFGDGAGLTGTFDLAGTSGAEAKCGTKRKGKISATLGGAGEFYPEFRLTDVSGELAGSFTFLFPRVPLLCQWTGCCHTGYCPYFQASIKPEVTGMVGMTEGEPDLVAGLKFKNTTVDIGVTVAGTVGAGSEGSIYYVAGTIGGKPYIVLQFPGDADSACLNEYIQEVGFDLIARVVVECAWWKFEEEWVFELYTCPDDGKRYLLATPFGGTRRVTVVDRDYLDAPEGYCVFPPLGQKGRSVPGLPDPVLNVGTGPRPSVAATNDEGMLLFVYDDPNKPTGKHQEIYYARWDGSAWTTHAPLTDNLGPDVEPVVALDANDVPVAVWTAGPEPDGLETGPEDVLPGMEIAWSTYDDASDAWSVPVALTSNTHVDVLPWFERSLGGDLRVCWVSSPTNAIPAWHDEEVIPSLDVMAADWNGAAFSAPYAVAMGLSGVSQPSVARSATHEFLAYLRDVDANSATAEDREVTLRVRELGQPWGADVDLTFDDLADTAAQVGVDALGTPLVVWVKRMVPVMLAEGEESHVDQLWFAHWNGSEWDPPVMAFETDGISEPKLSRNEAGKLVLFWVAASDEFSDIYYSVYDANTAAWGLPQQVTFDQGAETMIALAESGGNILLAYVKRRIDLTDPSGVPQIGLSDLYLLEHVPTRDLHVDDSDVYFEPAHFAPGETVDICVDVHLGGDFAVADVEVDFHDGDPGAAGVLIGSGTINSLLPGGVATVCVSWLVPGDGLTHVIHVVVDPTDAISEGDETNNSATAQIFKPDLRTGAPVVLGYPAADMVIVGLEIRNVGTARASACTVEVRQNGSAEPALLSSAIAALEPGGSQLLHFSWDVASLTPGTYLLHATADVDGVVDEISETNNVASAQVPVLPDLQAEQWSAAVAGAAAQITIRNVGAKPMQATTVRAVRAGQVLGERPVSALDAGGTADLMIPLSGPVHPGTVTIHANPDSTGEDEVTLLNNEATVIVYSSADLDDDGNVDMDDLAVFATCIAGPGVLSPPPGATAQQFARADLDGDLDVDLADFKLFEAGFTGP